MTERGVIAIDRGLFGHGRFADEPFTEREAWIWLIGEAAFRQHYRRVAGARVALQRGQLAHSYRFMADRWKWSEASVRRFIKRLSVTDGDDDAMLDAHSDAGITVVTIRNYDSYQSVVRFVDASNDAPTVAPSPIRRDAGSDAAPTQLTIDKTTNIGAVAPERDAPDDAGMTQERRKGESIEVVVVGGGGVDAAVLPAWPEIVPTDFALRFLQTIKYPFPENAASGVSMMVTVWRARGYDPNWVMAIAAEIAAEKIDKRPLSYFYKAIERRHDERAREIAREHNPTISPKVSQHEKSGSVVAASGRLVDRIREFSQPDRVCGGEGGPDVQVVSEG